MAQSQEPDPVADLLRLVPSATRVKREAWEATYDATDAADLERRLKTLALPDSIKRDLRDLKFGTAEPEEEAPSAAWRAASEFYQKSPLSLLTPIANLVRHPVKTVTETSAKQAEHGRQAATKAREALASVTPMMARGRAALEAAWHAGASSPVLGPVLELGAGLGAAHWNQARQAWEKAREAVGPAKPGVIPTRGLSATEALGHAVAAALPLLGPAAADVGEHGARGDVAGMVGGTSGLLSGAVVPTGTRQVGRIFQNPNPVEAAAVEFAQSKGIPVDLGTASGNWAARGARYLADRSLVGSVVAKRAHAEEARALENVGRELADRARPGAPATPEQAGAATAQALEAKELRHHRVANRSYDVLREAEANPTNRMMVPAAKAPVDLLADPLRGQVRRIVHELDAAPYTPRQLRPTRTGGGLEHVPGTGGAGAQVFDDILGRLPSGNPSRGAVQAQLEKYLAGGPETPVVKAALEVAEERGRGAGGRTVSKPELPPSAMEMPTRLEGERAGWVEMGLPVDLRDAKAALAPLEGQMMRQMSQTKQAANPGLKSVQNILAEDDFAPLSRIDRDLGVIKGLARKHGGLARKAVATLEEAVDRAAKQGSPEVVQARNIGRQATTNKYATRDVAKQLNKEPVEAFKQLTAPNDSGIDYLRQVAAQTPNVLPGITRALLDDLLHQATAEGGFQNAARIQKAWERVGPSTRQILFPDKGHVQDLNNFFLYAKKAAENPNPSGSGFIGSLGLQGAMFWTNPLAALLLQTGAAGTSTLLRSPRFVRALTHGMRLTVTPGAKAGVLLATAAENVRRAAEEAGVPITIEGAPATQEAPAR